ncbi:MAG: holo-ACP synthase [Ruthenibacterium sp.]
MQIYGIGVDSTTISRIEKSMARPGFLEKCFGAEEQTLFLHSRSETVAANFAAKEALSKALGTGLFGFVFSEVQVLRKEGGAPYFAFNGAMKQNMIQQKLTAHLSLTHEGSYATAFVILEKESNNDYSQ